ncbi:AraC family ligand binding domain-containing protein, partial [Paenibacillus sepulcri]|nr:AraC family ligand binding domain-containing protein [Paenibacillus sepulcri]
MDIREVQRSSPPFVPYIRNSEYAIRRPWDYPERRLLDYLLIYIQEGICQITVDRRVYRFEAGQFCLVQPGSLVVLEGLTDTITPYAHLDVFYNPERERSFATRPGQLDLSAY